MTITRRELNAIADILYEARCEPELVARFADYFEDSNPRFIRERFLERCGIVTTGAVINECVRYPDIHVQLTGTDGNAYSILGRVTKALRDNGVDGAEQKEFYEEATSSDYEHLLRTCTQWVEVS